MKTQAQLLRTILTNEALEAKYGAIADNACREMAERFGEFKKGDKVLYKPKHFENGDWRFGVVKNVVYDTHKFFRYIVVRMTKNWERMHEQDQSFNYISKNEGQIKKSQ